MEPIRRVTPSPAQLKAAVARIKEVRRDTSPVEVPFPAHEGLVCENCGFVSHSVRGSVCCGKCGSRSTLWLSQLIHITGAARKDA